ncbi:MAG: four helix bundle protein [Alloprevotella sp.]
MSTSNLIAQKSEDFAVRIINLYKLLKYSKNECVMSVQCLRSGTSIGANVQEAICAISRKDFLAKMYIAFKESRETKYWLRLLYKTGYIEKKSYESILADCDEILAILSSITKTTACSKNQKRCEDEE